MTATPEGLVDALAAQIAASVAALLGETARIAPAADAPEVGWAATISCAGTLRGHLVVGLPDADVRRISGLVMAVDHEVADEAVADTLKEVCSQALGSVMQSEIGRELRLEVVGVEQTGGRFEGRGYTFALSGGVTPHLVIRSLLEELPPADGPGLVAMTPGGTPATQAPARDASSANVRNLDVLLDIELPLAVRFGQTELPLQMLVRLGPGSVIDLRRSADEPVDVMVSGKVIARGEVVVVDGNYGVRVTEIMSTAERIRSMGA